MAWLLSHPRGPTALEIAGAFVVGAGLFEIYQAWSGRLKQKFAKSRLSAAMGVVALGLVGYGFYMWVLAIFGRPG